MSKSDFDQFVKRQQAEQQEATATFEPQQQLDEWLSYLNALYRDITRYLEGYIHAGEAQIDYRDVTLNEDFIGAYVAREMILKIGPSTVTFTPIATMLIGMKGRVEVQGATGRASLILVNKLATSARSLIQIQVRVIRPGASPLPLPKPSPDEMTKIQWVWKIAAPPPQMKFIELTQNTFYDMILEVANG
jgi:hypothetical protein